MSSDDKTPDEVEKLADALYDDSFHTQTGDGVKWLYIPLSKARTLARDAAAVGARTALEALDSPQMRDGLTLAAREMGWRDDWFTEDIDNAIAATYTTDEETTE
jgi:hypothetical protein